MRIVFMGTPDLAATVAQGLFRAGHSIPCVFTQPDRPRGRKSLPAPPPVKEWALEKGITVHQPRRPRRKSRLLLEEYSPDVVVVAAYGNILSPRILKVPRLGCLNVHTSLLPAYRGAAPIQWAIANGDAITGVTIMQMDEGLDSGDILTQADVPIGPQDTGATLHDRLAEVGSRLLVETLARLAQTTIRPRPQDHSLVSFAPLLSRDDAHIDWAWPRRKIIDRVRGFHSWPGAFTRFGNKQLKVFPMVQDLGATDGSSPGTILEIAREGLTVACGDGTLRLPEVQLQGKRRMKAFDFASGARVTSGQILG
jgi:methionyl-tRNA formyltransferase